MSVIYCFPYDSPVRYLPLVYLLPCDLISRFPTLRRLPRSMGALNASPEWGKVILSQQFFGEITDAVASLVFPHFGFGGWKEHYTGWCPVWRLSYALPLWAKGGWSRWENGARKRCSACPLTISSRFQTRRRSEG